MDKENVAHSHIRVLLSSKNNDILNFACKWMEVENTILGEVTQTKKNINMVCTPGNWNKKKMPSIFKFCMPTVPGRAKKGRR